jgi:hypothetical protein
MHCTGSLYRKSSAPADGDRWDAALRFAGLAMPRRKAAQVDAVESRKAAGSASLPTAYHVVWCGVWTAHVSAKSTLPSPCLNPPGVHEVNTEVAAAGPVKTGC